MSENTDNSPAPDTAAASGDAQVIVYSTPWCAFCRTEKQWLDSLGVKYTAKDIEEDPSAKDELLAKSDGQFSGVPVTDINGQLILGFDRPKLQDALKQAGLLGE